MPDFVAKRGPNDEGWRWDDASALAVLPAIVVLIVLAAGGGGGGIAFVVASRTTSSSPSPSASATTSAGPAPIDPPTPSPTTPPTPAATPASPYSLALWSRQASAWVFGDLGADAGSYREGESVPFLVRVRGAVPGATYDVSIVYDCRQPGGAAFDFLAGTDEYGEAPLRADSGPGRPLPDAAIPVPDDAQLTQDDPFAGFIELWGGRFLRLGSGPTPKSACQDHKVVQTSLTATGDSLYIISSAHLATAGQWSGQGAASAAPFGLEVTVRNVGTARHNMLPGSVAP